MLLVRLSSDKEINWERAFISHLLADQKVFLREKMIKLGGKMSSIILKALKGHEFLWYNYTYVTTRDWMLQLDVLSLHHKRLKILTPKKIKWIVIQEEAKMKRTQRPTPTGKGKKPMEKENKESNEECHPQSNLS